MKRIRIYIIIDSLSYTVTLLIQAVLNGILGNDWTHVFSGVYLLQLFTVCTLIASLMYFTDKWLEDHLIWQGFTQLAEIFAAVFGVGGGIFGWFEWRTDLVLTVSLMLVAVYAATYGIMLLQDMLLTRDINEKLAAERKGKNGKNH